MILSCLKNLFNETLDLIYKRKCINCACVISKGILCKTCAKDVQNLPAFPQGYINGYKLYSSFKYENIIKKMIINLKFKHSKNLAFYIALYLYDYLKTLKNENLENPIIMPIPTSKKNFYSRGYDNVLEIAKKLSEISGYKLNSTALSKIKNTVPQYKLKRNQRRKNVRNSFSLDKNFNHEGLIILLDDISTTGATLETATELFKKRGFKNLICLTFAKTKL